MGLSDIPSFLGVKRKARVGVHQSYGVTTLGKEKAEQFALSGGPRFKVLDYLANEGPCSITEVERECGMTDDKVKMIIKSLMNDGYVQSVSQGV